MTVGGVRLTLAVGDFDHVRDLTSGAVVPDGIELNCLRFEHVEEMFFRFLNFREWEVSEVSFGAYAALISRGSRDLTAIPVFPARSFRQSSVYVRSEGPVEAPEDLAGRRVGVPAWSQTAGIYARGWLMRQHGLRLEDVEWFQAGLNQPGRIEPVEVELPEGVEVASVADRTLDAMLRDGELDAIISARPPLSFERRDPGVRKLVEDFVEVEEEYYRETGIFPIMHVVVIRRDVLDRDPWVATNLMRAFEEAKRRSLARVLEATVPGFPIPWASAYARRARELFGEDFWPYGLEANRPTLEAFLGFAAEQGVCSRRLAPEELFPARVLSEFKV